MFRRVEQESVEEIITALEKERKRLELSCAEVDRIIDGTKCEWSRNVRLKRLSLGRLIRICKGMDIEINLVNREGVSIL